MPLGWSPKYRYLSSFPSLFPVVRGNLRNSRGWEVPTSCCRRTQRQPGLSSHLTSAPWSPHFFSLHLFCHSWEFSVLSKAGCFGNILKLEFRPHAQETLFWWLWWLWCADQAEARKGLHVGESSDIISDAKPLGVQIFDDPQNTTPVEGQWDGLREMLSRLVADYGDLIISTDLENKHSLKCILYIYF